MMKNHLIVLWAALRCRIALLRRDSEAGYSTEAVLWTAALALLALAAVAVLATKILDKANGITL